MGDTTPSAPLGAAAAHAPRAGRTVPAQKWAQNVETGLVMTVTEAELAQLNSPWKQITADEAVRADLRSMR